MSLAAPHYVLKALWRIIVVGVCWTVRDSMSVFLEFLFLCPLRSLILLTVLSYIYAVFCLQIFADWLGSVDESAVESDDKLGRTVDSINYNFSSLVWCAYTLFKAISGGVEWGEALADPMYQVNTIMVISFVLYILATVFCVLNVIHLPVASPATVPA